jgi:hypothetical protein
MSAETPAVEIDRMDRKLVPVAIFAWLWVAIPFSYGLWKLLGKIDALF